MTGDHVVYPAACAGMLSWMLRGLFRSPEQIVGRFIKSGDTVLELGSGLGFFSLPMARMVGENGTVIAADVQGEMLALLMAAVEREGLASRFQFHLAGERFLLLDIPQIISFTLAFHVTPQDRGP